MAHSSLAQRVALYARISTKNHGQDPETQLVPLREYANARGFYIVEEYVDVGVSGARQRRPALDRLMREARYRRFDVILVARFDRFARSAKHLVLALEEFQALGVDFISLSESIDTSTPMGKMVFTVISAVAELERSLIRERILLGLERAKAKGKRLGRPRTKINPNQVKRLRRDSGFSLREIARLLGVSHSTVAKILREV